METIEIDYESCTLEKVRGFAFCRRRHIVDLAKFDSVRLVRRAEPVEEGYGRMVFALVLDGPEASSELFSTDDEKHAERLHRDLTALFAVRRTQAK